MLAWLRELWLDLTWTYPMGMSRAQAAAWMQALAEEAYQDYIRQSRRLINQLKKDLE